MTKARKKGRLLAVDDAPDTLELLQRNLAGEGYTVFTASSVAEAIRVLDESPVDIVITDMKMPEVTGLELVRHVRQNLPDTGIIVITGYPSVDGVVEAMKTGADEYVSKPFTSKELSGAVRRVSDKLSARREARVEGVEARPDYYGLIGESAVMQSVYREIEKAAATDATVLIAGESGTGKELVARTVHCVSPRSAAPFIPVNCGGIPKDLLESELFGHVKGAFTGANATRPGFFQNADGGTIFLDEVSETSPAMQVRLLRVLQDREIAMVGSRKPETVDVRIVAATNKNLKTMVKENAFREDLYYRLDVIRIALPPLRDRGNDILLLASHMLAKYAAELGKPAPRLADETINAFTEYYWPGNVRELENVVLRLVAMSESDVIDVTQLPSAMRFRVAGGAGLDRTLEEVEIEHIVRVLESVGGNKSRAAKVLGIDVKTLREKLKRREAGL
jgi:two-component system response regulator HydG